MEELDDCHERLFNEHDHRARPATRWQEERQSNASASAAGKPIDPILEKHRRDIEHSQEQLQVLVGRA
jgi:hypothetical protein